MMTDDGEECKMMASNDCMDDGELRQRIMKAENDDG